MVVKFSKYSNKWSNRCSNTFQSYSTSYSSVQNQVQSLSAFPFERSLDVLILKMPICIKEYIFFLYCNAKQVLSKSFKSISTKQYVLNRNWLITFSPADKVHGSRSYESPLLLLGRLTVTAAVATTRVAVVMVASCMLLLMLMMVVLLGCPRSSSSLPILLLLLFLRLLVRFLRHIRVKWVSTERFISSFKAQKSSEI